MKTAVELDGVFRVYEPKTEKGKRLIVLQAVAVDGLHTQRKRLMTEGLAARPLVFPDAVGEFLRHGSGNHRAFQRILKTAGLLEMTWFHDLRQSHATMLRLAGVYPRVCQDRLGHSQISITLVVYSHVLPTTQADAAEKVGLLSGIEDGRKLVVTPDSDFRISCERVRVTADI